LISDKVNIWPAIVEEEAGLVETDTVEGTQRLLERWLSLPDEQCLRMQDSARRCFQTHFEIHSLYERLMTILEQIVSEGKKERG
jgi:hypothetical protein